MDLFDTSYLDLLGPGFTSAFGLGGKMPDLNAEAPVQDTSGEAPANASPDKKRSAIPNFTDAQLAMLAKLGNSAANSGLNAPRAPAAVGQRQQMMPMAQIQLPNAQAPTAVRPTLAQLIYGR